MSNPQPSTAGATRSLFEIIINAIETSTFFTIFVSFVNSLWELEILGKLKDIIFPTAAFAAVAKSLIASYDLYSSPNKTSSRWANFGLKLAGAALVVTAVLGSILAAAAYLILAPVLFLVAIGLDFLYCSTLLGWNTVKYTTLKAPTLKDNPSENETANYEIKKERYQQDKKQYNENMWKYGKGALVTAVCAVAVGLLMLSKVGLIPLAIGMVKTTVAGCVGAGAAVVTGGIGGKGIFDALRAQMKSKAKVSPVPTPSAANEPLLDTPAPTKKTAISLEAATNQTNSWETPTSMFKRNYSPYFTKNRQEFVERIKNDGEKRTYLVAQINSKIQKLGEEISNENSFFKFQKEKRENKQNALRCLLEIMEQPSLDEEINTAVQKFKYKYQIQDTDTSSAQALYSKVKNLGVFQSFKFLKGDVEDIFDAALEFESPSYHRATWINSEGVKTNLFENNSAAARLS